MFRLPLTRVRSSGGTFTQVVLASASISFQRFCAACSLAMELALICLLVRGGAGATARVLSADSGRFMVNSLFFVMQRRSRRNCRTPLPVAAETRNPIGHAPGMATPQLGTKRLHRHRRREVRRQQRGIPPNQRRVCPETRIAGWFGARLRGAMVPI